MKKFKAVQLLRSIGVPGGTYVPAATYGCRTPYSNGLWEFRRGCSSKTYSEEFMETYPEWFQITYEPEERIVFRVSCLKINTHSDDDLCRIFKEALERDQNNRAPFKVTFLGKETGY